MSDAHEDDIDQLNSFLRGERSAVETYSQAIEKLSDEPVICQSLRECKSSHEERVQELSSEIQRLGGKAAEDSGAWGGFAKLMEGGAKMFGKGPAISVLEEGEDHGLKDYREDSEKLTPAVRTFVQTKLLPEQQRTHDRMSALQKSV